MFIIVSAPAHFASKTTANSSGVENASTLELSAAQALSALHHRLISRQLDVNRLLAGFAFLTALYVDRSSSLGAGWWRLSIKGLSGIEI